MSCRVLIHGTGAIGAVYAYLLTKAGCDVTAVCRSNYDAAKADGFHIDSPLFGKGLHVRPHVVRSTVEAAELGPYDYVFVTAKILPGANISETIAPAVTSSTTIVLIQNGIGIEGEYAARFPNSLTISGVAYLPATQTKPGHIEMGNVEILQLGAFPSGEPQNPAWQASATKLVALLQSAGSNAEWFDDI